MYQSFETFKNSHEAQVTLRCIHETMKTASQHHDIEGEESWRRKGWYHHVVKFFHHGMKQFENEKMIVIDSQPTPTGSPPTWLPHAILALTRLHFVVNHWNNKGLLPFIPSEGPVVDTREIEPSGE